MLIIRHSLSFGENVSEVGPVIEEDAVPVAMFVLVP
jgi:hypothetical protein